MADDKQRSDDRVLLATVAMDQLKIREGQLSEREENELVFDPSSDADLAVLNWPRAAKRAILAYFFLPDGFRPDWRDAIQVRRDILRLEALLAAHSVRAEASIFETIALGSRQKVRTIRKEADLGARAANYANIVGIAFASTLVGLVERSIFGYPWTFAAPLILVGLLLVAEFSFAAVVLAASRWIMRQLVPPYRSILVFILVPVVLLLVSAISLMGTSSQNPSLLHRVTLGLFPAFFFLIVFDYLASALSKSFFRRYRRDRIAPHEAVAFALFECLNPRLSLAEKNAFIDIEKCAVTIEREALRLGFRGDRTLRPWAANLGKRMAETIRQHKRVLAMPSIARESVERSLLNGMLYAARGDLEKIALHVPPQVLPSLLRRWAPRVLTVVFLLFLAASAPYLLPHSTGRSQLLSIRLGLVVTSIFTLVAPSISDLRQQVADFVNRATGGRSL